MTRTIPSLLAAIVAAAALLSGCAAPNTTAVTASAGTDNSGVYQTYLQADNTRLARQVLVRDVRIDQAPSGFLRASISVTSARNKSMQLQAKFVWFDAHGVEIDPDAEAWRIITLEGRDTRSIVGIAPSPAAESFRLRVREAEHSKKFVH